MNSFEYYNPVKIIFGENSISKIQKEIPSQARVLITYGGGSIKANGVLKQVQKALGKHFTMEFGGIEPNPEYETLMKATGLVKKHDIDFLLAVGGGSVLDGTKFIAAAAKLKNKDAWNFLDKRQSVKQAITLASIMTLPATGSEMNPYAVISRRATKQKLAFGNPLLFPQFSVLDPNTTKSLPKKQKANGVCDAFIHVLEQYLTYPNYAEIQDQWAEGVLRTLITYGPDYVNNEFEYHNAANIMWAATCALNGIIGTGVAHDWATHTIGHEITALYGLDHAETLAIVMPGMMEVMKDEKAEKLQRFAKEVFHIPDDKFNVQSLVREFEEFLHTLGIKTQLADYHINKTNIDLIIFQLERGGEIKLGETGKLDKQRVSQLLHSRL